MHVRAAAARLYTRGARLCAGRLGRLLGWPGLLPRLWRLRLRLLRLQCLLLLLLLQQVLLLELLLLLLLQTGLCLLGLRGLLLLL